MTTKAEAKQRIAAAEKATSQAIIARQRAVTYLESGVATNGAGVLRDPQLARSHLLAAQEYIKEALDAIENADWPSEADYDHL